MLDRKSQSPPCARFECDSMRGLQKTARENVKIICSRESSSIMVVTPLQAIIILWFTDRNIINGSSSMILQFRLRVKKKLKLYSGRAQSREELYISCFIQLSYLLLVASKLNYVEYQHIASARCTFPFRPVFKSHYLALSYTLCDHRKFLFLITHHTLRIVLPYSNLHGPPCNYTICPTSPGTSIWWWLHRTLCSPSARTSPRTSTAPYCGKPERTTFSNKYWCKLENLGFNRVFAPSWNSTRSILYQRTTRRV